MKIGLAIEYNRWEDVDGFDLDDTIPEGMTIWLPEKNLG